ncbi:ribosome biogenesis GTPase A [Dethiosulfatibacter aminovorans DSM 17477]|uniref:Ribosome biogenesis GTPase A n=1 Tax=Dethiosulfatibacter aminovorans DSM 17477 TaxID=1121476 RepID=A0A1M6DG97_9FIRM|nr:ribosome biogenesis GTPase YlqF [Dethiosulfatibacter aminovorans]SHI72018.1 ribosome biogenesis GTPase A [Dethiosulfatibacter aminovorans DSM 17477]
MAINWYPGHMKKTNELIRENLKIVDLVIEIVDARIPYSSRNPILKEISANKHHIIVMNKSDLADSRISELWKKEYTKDNTRCIMYNSTKDSTAKFFNSINDIADEILLKYKKKGFFNRQLKAMVVGIPNVGKSTFINRIAKRKGAATGDKPGVTKGKQWIKVKNGIDLLDTPGILWPKIETDIQGYNLACTGAIREEILNKNDIATYIVEFLNKNYKDYLVKKYQIETGDKETYAIIDDIARRNGCILKGDELDYERVSRLIINDFRSGKLGKITMEKPENA